MAKKKKSKYIVLSIIGIIAILIVINWGNLKFMFDMMSSYRKYESREETVEKEETHESFDDTNPILQAIEKEKAAESSKSTNSEKTDEEKDSSIEKDNDEKKDIKNSNTESYINILSKYNDKFVALQNDYEGKLNSLISQGYSEYKSGNISKRKLATNYMSKGRALEKESDEKVNALVKEMEEELKSNGLDPSIAKDVKSYYISYKENRRGEIMAKANKAMN